MTTNKIILLVIGILLFIVLWKLLFKLAIFAGIVFLFFLARKKYIDFKKENKI